MLALAIGYGSWVLGVFFSLVAAWFDRRFETRSAAEDAVREALIWYLVLLPWREWLPSASPGKHRSVHSSEAGA